MKIQRNYPGSRIPELATDGAGGFDMFADAGVVIYPGEQYKVSLGVRVEIPANHVGLLMPRSGKGSKGMHLANVIGLIDSDYRGVLMANIKNNSNEPMSIRIGESIAQMVIVPCWTPQLQVVESLTSTERGEGGFGSTDTSEANTAM